MNQTNLLHATDELRKLLLENPSLPLLIFAGESCNSGDYSYMSCSYIKACKGEFLDCMQTINDELCYTDRDEFREDLEDCYCDHEQDFVESKLKEYEPYWRDCIILYVDN